MKFNQMIFFLLFTLFSIYSFVVYTNGTEQLTAYRLNDKGIAGKDLFQNHNCISCHQIYGLGGFLGPELTAINLDKNTGEPFARAILKHGTGKMPDFKLSDNDIDCIIEYLRYIRTTANNYQ